MQRVQSAPEIKSILEAFETALLSPIVCGDLNSWLQQLQATWSEVAAQVHHQSKHVHPRQYEEIGTQDPELLPQVQLLEAEDEAIQADCDTIEQCLAGVVEHVPKLEPDEEKAKKHLQGLIDDATKFLGRVRKQQIALQTWYVEAFNRDRGAVD